MPGTDPAEAIAVILGELPGLLHLLELPARGPGADPTGWTAAMLVEMPTERRRHRSAGRRTSPACLRC
jgi:hypothetical protein